MNHEKTCVAERCHFTPGDYIDQKWKVKSFLGEGTFGQVFCVTDSNGKPYALKLLKLWEVIASERPNLLKRFEREYETGQIPSDYLVHSVAKGMVRGNSYIVMEYCPCGDLNSALKQTRVNLPLMARQVLLGLRDLHANGKVHRDLKPENVLLRDSSHAVLTDFGISGDQNNRLTQRGWTGVPQQRFGTIAYMPPEQVNPKRGNATVLTTTDIFSFGVMMYQLLTGNLPFGQLESEADVPRYVNNVQRGNWDRARLSGSDGAKWLPVIEGCLVPDFRQRLQTIDDVLKLMPNPGASIPDPVPDATRFNRDASAGLLLRVMQGEELGRTYALNSLFSDGNTIITIGRASADTWNSISIEETETCFISRQHCTIEKDPGGNVWVLRDGQFRCNCEYGLRQHSLFPCDRCNIPCSRRNRMQWKNSLNGTYVNSQEVGTYGAAIKPGDIISIGDVKLRVEGA